MDTESTPWLQRRLQTARNFSPPHPPSPTFCFSRRPLVSLRGKVKTAGTKSQTCFDISYCFCIAGNKNNSGAPGITRVMGQVGLRWERLKGAWHHSHTSDWPSRVYDADPRSELTPSNVVSQSLWKPPGRAVTVSRNGTLYGSKLAEYWVSRRNAKSSICGDKISARSTRREGKRTAAVVSPRTPVREKLVDQTGSRCSAQVGERTDKMVWKHASVATNTVTVGLTSANERKELMHERETACTDDVWITESFLWDVFDVRADFLYLHDSVVWIVIVTKTRNILGVLVSLSCVTVSAIGCDRSSRLTNIMHLSLRVECVLWFCGIIIVEDSEYPTLCYLFCTFSRNMASSVFPPSALFALVCLHCLCVSTVCGVNSRTRHSSQSVLATLDSEFSMDHYFSPHIHGDTQSVWTRHKRAVRNVEYQANPVSEDRRGMLFTVSSAISDANLRRFTLNSTSAGSNLVTVDGSNGNVYLAIDQRLDYENEQMRPLIIVIEATSLTDRFGTGNVVLRCVGMGSVLSVIVKGGWV